MPTDTIIKGTKFSTVTRQIQNISAKQIAGVARKELIQSTVDRGWSRFKSTIKQDSIDADTEKVYITDDKDAKKIAGFQHYGTPAHGPVTAKALRFKPKGASEFVFTKWVRGITATYFFDNTAAVLTAINKFVTERFHKAVAG